MRSLEALPPTETLEMENGLPLVRRVKLLLTNHPSLPSVSKPIDDWQLKRALMDFLKNSLSVAITFPEQDLVTRRLKDLKKRKREDPVAHGTLFIRDLGFLSSGNRDEDSDKEESTMDAEKKFLDWRRYIVEKMDGIEINLEGVKSKLSVEIPISDDFERMKKD